jgi:ABC-type multidrug transport system ATPase subunit
MALISAQGVGRRFGEQWVFRGIDVSLEAGQVLCVIGSNGSGKSTLLRVLSGLLSPSEGQVHRATAIGYSALDLALWPHLTALEHLRLAADLRGVPLDDKALEQVGIEKAANKLVGTFSTGMRARLKLALATQHAPHVLVLDEPTASLDEEGRALLDRTINHQRERGALVIATNDETDRRHATHELDLG